MAQSKLYSTTIVNIMKARVSAVCVALLSWVAQAQESVAVPKPPEETGQLAPVEISGVRDPDLKPYRTMLKGIAAYEANHGLAPNANLRFILKPQIADAPINGIEMRLVGDETSIPILVVGDGTFTLPKDERAAEENAELVLNRKKHSMRWRPFIRSPDVDPDARRLGDLRLECQILWAVEYDDIPFLVRNAFRLAGGPCKSSNIGVFFAAPRRIVAASISSGDRRETVRIGKSKLSFAPPLHDRSWSDDALIEFEFAFADRVSH